MNGRVCSLPRERTRPTRTRRLSSPVMAAPMRCAPSAEFQRVFETCRLRRRVHLAYKSLIYLAFFSRPTEPHPAAFILPSVGRLASAPLPHSQTCENIRHHAKRAQSHHCGLRSGDLGTNRPSACGLPVGGIAPGASRSCKSAARASLVEGMVDAVSNDCVLAGKSALDQPR